MTSSPGRTPAGGKFPWFMLIGLAVPVLIGLLMFALLASGVLSRR